MERSKPENIDAYLDLFPESTRKVLQKIRQTIKKAAPGADEIISYAIPCFKLKGQFLIYFAGYKNHVSVYPAPRGETLFKEELSAFKGGKGTVQFPLDKPIPYELITRIAHFRMVKNEEIKAGKESK